MSGFGMGRITWGVVAAGLVALAGCGSDSEDEGSGVALSEIPSRYAAAICSAYNRCMGELSAVFLRGEECEERTRRRLEDELPTMEASIAAKRARYDGTKTARCLDDVAARDCAGLLDRESPACNAALDGTVPLGQSCSSNLECQGDTYCKYGTSCPGTCSALELASGECDRDDQCASGLICSAATGRCVTPAAPGAPCNGSEPECAPGYVCAGANEEQGTPGTCRTYAEVFALGSGAACDILAGNFCQSELRCRVDGLSAQGIAATCQPPVPSGSACSVSIPDQCPSDEYCRIAGPAITGTCTKRPAAGEPCGPAGYEGEPSACAAYARCDSGRCRALAQLGEPCSSNEMCLSDNCRDGACLASNSCD